MAGAADKGDTHAVAAWLDEGGGVDARCLEELGNPTLLMLAEHSTREKKGACTSLEVGIFLNCTSLFLVK